jgi:hypothetical protein
VKIPSFGGKCSGLHLPTKTGDLGRSDGPDRPGETPTAAGRLAALRAEGVAWDVVVRAEGWAWDVVVLAEGGRGDVAAERGLGRGGPGGWAWDVVVLAEGGRGTWWWRKAACGGVLFGGR